MSNFDRAKQSKLDFEQRLLSITERIKNLRQEVVTLNKNVNQRNSNMVGDIVGQIEALLDFEGVAAGLNEDREDAESS